MMVAERKEVEEVEEYKMKFEKKDEELRIFFGDTHPTIVNSIRRTILDYVPTFAIEDVEFIKNDTGMYDEVIAHRLGLIPLISDIKNYNFKENCKCGGVGCALCEVKLTLYKNEPGYVYSGDLKSDDPAIVPALKDIPITKLLGEQKIEVVSKAILGVGREHAKWAPANSYISEVETKEGINRILHIEGFGQLSEEEIYNTALDILKNNLTSLKEALEK